MDTIVSLPEITPDIPPMTPYDGYKLMVEDYNSSSDGKLNSESGLHTSEELSELRRSLTHFAIQNGFGIELPATDTGVEINTLLSDLRKDEALSELADRYTTSATKPPVIDSESLKNPQILRIPQVTATEFGRKVLEKIGFSYVRSAGSHRIYKLQKQEGGSMSVSLPFRSNGEPIPPGTLRSIIKQTGLSLPQVIELLN